MSARPSSRPPNALLSVKEVAALLSASPDHVYDLIARGDITSIDIGVRSAMTRIRPSELDRYLESRTRPARRRASQRAGD